MKHDGTLSASTPKIITNQMLICSSILQKPCRALPQKAERKFYVWEKADSSSEVKAHWSAEALPPPGGTRQPFSSGPSEAAEPLPVSVSSSCRRHGRDTESSLPVTGTVPSDAHLKFFFSVPGNATGGWEENTLPSVLSCATYLLFSFIDWKRRLDSTHQKLPSQPARCQRPHNALPTLRPATLAKLPASIAPLMAAALSLLTDAGRVRKPCCKGRAGQRHSLRGDVEADISVLPQHIQHRAHGCRPRRTPLPLASPRAAVATGVVSCAPAAIGIGCGAARGGVRPLSRLP